MVDEEPWELDEDAFLAEWEAVDRQALALLESMLAEELASAAPQPAVDEAADWLLAGVEQGHWPYDYFVNAFGWQAPPTFPADDVLLDAVASTISPPADPGTDTEQQAAVGALVHADWLAIVVDLVRAGVGAGFSAEGIVPPSRPSTRSTTTPRSRSTRRSSSSRSRCSSRSGGRPACSTRTTA